MKRDPSSAFRQGRFARLLGACALGAFAAFGGLACDLGGIGRASPISPPEGLEPGGHHVLFIGNSLTYVNDLPRTLAGIAASGGDTIRVMMVARANFALIDHLNGDEAVPTIARGRWEYVVLQQGPSSRPENRDSLILWTQMFDRHIRSAGARPALFMVWPESDRFEFFDEVRISYQSAAEEVGGLFLPSGEAWLRAWDADPDLALYWSDGYHPSPLGTFLAALVMYERITGHDARMLPPRAVVNGRTLEVPEETVRLLQVAAHQANAELATR